MDNNLPKFSDIDPKQIEKTIDSILAGHRENIKDLLIGINDFTWDNLLQPLEEMENHFDNYWYIVEYLNTVVNQHDLRKAYNHCIAKISDYQTELGQNEELYQAIKNIADGPEYESLQPAQRKIIDNYLRDFHLSGVDLDKKQKHRFANIVKQLSELQTKFEENLLDATDNWNYLVENQLELAGMPEHTIITAKENAKQQGKTGWLLNLEAPCYLAVMQYADNRQLREKIYRAYITRASDQSPDTPQWDNTHIMAEIVKKRHEMAKLLGFHNYTEYSLVTKMADSSEDVMDFLWELEKRSKVQARSEFQELTTFAKEWLQDDLQPWDIAYYSEKLRKQRYDFSPEDLRPYFPEPKVLQGFFTIVNRLYGITFKEEKEFDTWHKDAKLFSVYDDKKNLRGRIYLDLYARPNKRGGAWMHECRNRYAYHNGDTQLPIAFLVCNFSGPVAGRPALFNHDEVITLFHEFGHALHHVLTKVDFSSVAGTHGVEWDGVELPSQFMENWCWEEAALELCSSHYETKQPLPKELLTKLKAAKNFQSALQMLRQLELAIFDFRIHREYEPEAGDCIQKILNEVRKDVAVAPAAEFNRFQHGFCHIFGSSYAAGYYSYKWAEILSSDAFAKFEEKGIFDRKTGQEFLESILEAGGSKPAIICFVEFRGRKPNSDALLRHLGIAKT